MCIIIAKDKGVKLPPVKHYEVSVKNNPHGIGISWHKRGWEHVKIKKGFDKLEKLISFMKEQKINEDTSFIIHFRWATAGIKGSGNCHPFPVVNNLNSLRKTTCRASKAVAHNGTFFDYSGDKKYSDSQLFIKDILSHPSVSKNLDSHAIQTLLLSYMSTNKLAVLSKDGVITLGKFEEKDGVFYSNDSYKDHTFRSRARYVSNYTGYSNNGYYDNSCWDGYGSGDYYEDVYLSSRINSHSGAISRYIKCEICEQSAATHRRSIENVEHNVCRSCAKDIDSFVHPSLRDDFKECYNCGSLLHSNNLREILDYDEGYERTTLLCKDCIDILSPLTCNIR